MVSGYLVLRAGEPGDIILLLMLPSSSLRTTLRGPPAPLPHLCRGSPRSIHSRSRGVLGSLRGRRGAAPKLSSPCPPAPLEVAPWWTLGPRMLCPLPVDVVPWWTLGPRMSSLVAEAPSWRLEM